MNWEFEQIGYAIGLLLLPLVFLRWMYINNWQIGKRKLFADRHLLKRFFGDGSTLNLRNAVLIFGIYFFLILALINLLSGVEKREVKRQGVDVVYCLDVSNSMNTRDVAPDRLEKAKKFIDESLKNMGGDRVGLVIFAGGAYTILPLTNDYNALRNMLLSVNTGLLEKQGTDLGAAVEEAGKMLNFKGNASKVVVLLTDGEDHEGNEGEADDIANQLGLTVYSVSFGTEKGGTIPIYAGEQEVGMKEDKDGNVVISKVQTNAIEELADDNHGFLINGNEVSRGVEELKMGFESLKKSEQKKLETWNAKSNFQWFIAIALILLLILTYYNYKNNFNV